MHSLASSLTHLLTRTHARTHEPMCQQWATKTCTVTTRLGNLYLSISLSALSLSLFLQTRDNGNSIKFCCSAGINKFAYLCVCVCLCLSLLPRFHNSIIIFLNCTFHAMMYSNLASCREKRKLYIFTSFRKFMTSMCLYECVE